MNGHGRLYKVMKDGFQLPKIYSDDNYYDSLKYQAKDDDIFIVTYPKSGTTWTSMILHLLKSGCIENNDLKSFNLFDYVVYLEEDGPERLHMNNSPNLIKTHLDFTRLPWNDNAKYVFVCRNPFDVCVSFYNHSKGFTECYDFKDGSFDEYFELFINGQVDQGDYFEHLNGLCKEKERKNVFFVTYESMKEDIRKVIKELALFLGGEFHEKVKDEEFLNKVIRMSSFSSMKEIDRFDKKRDPEEPKFVRKGVIGDYKNYLKKFQFDHLMNRFKQSCSKEILDLWRPYFLDEIQYSGV